jgi:hypothetical protein
MSQNLHDYTNEPTPELLLSTPILHPTNHRKVIGHSGTDKARRIGVAAFPRRKDEHWFRGSSTSGLTGYGFSDDVLDRLDRNSKQKIERILVVEKDGGRVIEYERAAFSSATVVAYSPELNNSVIGDEAMRVDEEVYHDQQKVLPVSRARRVYDRDEVTINL